MVQFLEIKDEEILKYLLLIIIGYLIFNTCGNGFNVGGAYGGSGCSGPYNPNDSNTYCENGDIKYKCNTGDVCNSYNSDDICTDSSSPYIGLEKNKCPSMNMPPYRETRTRDGASQNLLEHYCGTDPKYLSNYRDLILRGGETIVGPPNYVNNTWEGNDRCWTSPDIEIPGSMSMEVDPEYVKMLGDPSAFDDCELSQEEIASDPDAAALVQAFINSQAALLGVDPSTITVTNLHTDGNHTSGCN